MGKSWQKYLATAFCLCVGGLSLLAAQSDFSRGESFFRADNPDKAVPYLQKAIENKEDPKAYLYLALCYFQQGNYAQALTICSEGMDAPGTNKKILAYDAGNIAFAMEDYNEADRWYSLAIAADANYASPVLNRANTRLKQGRFKECKEDYINYIKLSPESEQGNTINAIIAMLDDQMENEKKAEVIRVEQERKQRDEEQRIAAERARQEVEAAQRRKKLLEDVASSLQDVSTENISAGAEGTMGYGYESELD